MHTRQLRAACLVLAVSMVLAAAASAFAVGGPSTRLTFDPPIPDGTNGWWRSAPLAYGTADGDGLLHYDWGTGEETVAVTAGEAAYLGFSPEGTWTLSAFAEDSLGATGTTVTRALKTDTVPPTRPLNLLPAAGIGAPGFRWDPCSDGTSGLSHYAVYRNLVGPPFTEGDRVATVDGGTTFGETDPLPSGFVFYGVRAFDEAGNASLMSDAIRLSTDIVAPTAPGDLEAWLNGRGFIRVSWEASYDRASGVAGYVVQRAFPGQEMSTLATVPAGALFWDDADAEAVASGDCSYQVFAFDRAGNPSPVAGPAVTQADLIPPSGPDAPLAWGALDVLQPEARSIPVAISVMWTDSEDDGSGIAGYHLGYGPDAEDPAFLRSVADAQVLLRPDVESAHWWYAVRAEDRAGNVSAWSDATLQHVASLDEVSGSDRVATAIAASRAAFAASDDVVVASAWSFPDGLAAASLAGTLRAPVLLVGPGAARSDVVDELQRLGAADAWVVGGTAAVSDSTAASLDTALSGTVTRVAGPDRYGTAAAVAAKVRELRGTPAARAILVSGRNYPDALSAGPLAYETGWPILFATPTGLPAVTLSAIAASGATETLIVGSGAAVWAGADRLVPAAERLAGLDRYDTSVQLAEWAVDRGLLSAARPVLVTGRSFPDGLAAAPLAGERNAPVLLSEPEYLPYVTREFLSLNGADVHRITALGRTLVPAWVYWEAWDAVQLRPEPSEGAPAPGPAPVPPALR